MARPYLASLAIVLLVAGVSAHGIWRSAQREAAADAARVAAEQASVRAQRRADRALAELARLRATPLPSAPDCPADCADECFEAALAACPEPVAPTPDPVEDTAATERLREHLERRLEVALPPDVYDEAVRERALELMLEIREATEADAAGVGSPGAEAQRELVELTGQSVGQLLEAMRAPESRRVLRPHESEAALPGEVRRRFVDELSRELGVATPGEVEVVGEPAEPRP